MVRLYSADTELDVGEFSTTLTFSIADIREPDKRNASFSKTITLPGTKANNIFFENMFEVDVVTQTFNPNAKARTILSIDGVTQFKGALKLRQVNYLTGGRVTYDCNLIGNISDFIQSLGTATIRDLDLSAYNHTFSYDNVEAGWIPTIGTGYCYPMINYGEASNLNEWFVGYFRPAPFVKTVWDAIFSEAGYSYSSAFVNSNFFKRLIVPNSNDRLRLTGTQINARLFNAGRTSAQQFPDTNDGVIGPPNYTTTVVQINNDSTVPYFDNDGSFNVANYSHEPTYIGTNTYIFKCDVQLMVSKDAGGAFGFDFGGGITGFINRIDSSGFTTQLNSFYLSLTGVAANAAGNYFLTGTIEFAAENITVGLNERYYVSVEHAVFAAFTTTVIQWSITNISFRNQVVNDVINIGDTVVLANSLPDMLQKDFVMGIVKMFNLYMEQDPNNDLLLNIAPRNDYYNTTQIDWTAKLATEKDIEIEPMALLNFKRLICSYKSDNDYYNKIYKSETARVYGDYREDIANDFVTGEYKVETNFAPTPLQGNYDNDRIIPALFAASGNPPAIELTGGLPRILYWGGLKSCEQWDFRYFSLHNYKTQYPYAGHLDDPQNPTLDLSYGVPLKTYYGTNQFISSLQYTDNNLYNGYYKQMLDEITDRDSKLVTGWFWLNPVDILSLDFRKVYRVGSHSLRLNKIYDYNPVKATLTKCEFIKIKDVEVFAANEVPFNGGLDVVINSKEDAPVIDLTTYQDGNVVGRPSSTVITGEKNYAGGGLSTWIGGRRNRVHGRDSSGVAIFGEDNTVQAAASGVSVFGYGNTIGFGVKNLFLHGKNNIIAPGLSNIALINTDNQTVSESDVTYINNEKIKKSNNFCPEYCTDWFSTNSKTLFSAPLDVTGLGAPGVGLVLIPKFILFALDANTPFDYADSMVLGYSTDINNGVPITNFTRLNSAVDVFLIANVDAFGFVANDKMQLKVLTQDATVGNGTFYVKVIYSIEGAPF